MSPLACWSWPSPDGRSTDSKAVARLYGLFNVAGGLWPLVHLPSFEAVSGPGTDRWLGGRLLRCW
jgi:hypothetical protein